MFAIVERIRCRGLPDELGLAIDSNTTYDVKRALAVGRTASEYGLEWFEEPISHTNVRGQAQLNRDLEVPISGYQNHLAHYPAVDHLEANVLEIYQLALDYCGGITAAHRIGTLIEPYDKQLVPHAFGPVINYSASVDLGATAAGSPADVAGETDIVIMALPGSPRSRRRWRAMTDSSRNWTRGSWSST